MMSTSQQPQRPLRQRDAKLRETLKTAPVNDCLSTLPEDPLNELVSAAHQRWRIERDYQDLKQGFGLGH